MMLELELAPVIETKVQSVAVVSSGQSLNHSLWVRQINGCG